MAAIIALILNDDLLRTHPIYLPLVHRLHESYLTGAESNDFDEVYLDTVPNRYQEAIRALTKAIKMAVNVIAKLYVMNDCNMGRASRNADK